MKATLKFAAAVIITKTLPHEAGDKPSDFYWDSVGVVEGQLVLGSKCGSTSFSNWEDKDDHYVVPATARVAYEGARNALNAVWGVEFPTCEVTEVESTIGRFENLEDYDEARRLVLPLMRNVEAFLRDRHDTHDGRGGQYIPGSAQARREQAEEWLRRATEALGTIIRLDDCGNPRHAEESLTPA